MSLLQIQADRPPQHCHLLSIAQQPWTAPHLHKVRLSQTEVLMRQIGDRIVLVQRSALAAYRALEEIRAAAGNIAA